MPSSASKSRVLAGAGSPAEADSRGRYVYGIIRCACQPDADELTGIAGAPVDFVVNGRLAAVTSKVSRDDFAPAEQERADTASIEAAVRAHEDVVEACLARGPVVPFRFATALRTREDVCRLLEERHAFWTLELQRLERKHEWGVKAMVDEAVVSSWVRRNRPDMRERERELDAQSAGAAYFGRKRLQNALSAEGDAVVAEATAAAHERLAACAVDSKLLPVRRRGAPEQIRLNAAYLVAEDSDEAFQAELEVLTAQDIPIGLRYELSGPWPAYNFLSEEAGGP